MLEVSYNILHAPWRHCLPWTWFRTDSVWLCTWILLGPKSSQWFVHFYTAHQPACATFTPLSLLDISFILIASCWVGKEQDVTSSSSRVGIYLVPFSDVVKLCGQTAVWPPVCCSNITLVKRRPLCSSYARGTKRKSPDSFGRYVGRHTCALLSPAFA